MQSSEQLGVIKVEKLELTYDHYKETVARNNEAQSKRNKLFVILCVFNIASFIMLLFPVQLIDGVIAFVESQYEISVEVSISFFYSIAWIAVTYTLVRYFQTMIYIERQYKYIHLLEQEIGSQLECTYFNRESKLYMDSYPKALDLVHMFYTWIIPLLIIVVNLLRIILEFPSSMSTWSLLHFTFNALCFLFCLGLSILYLAFMHPRKKRNKPQKGPKVK